MPARRTTDPKPASPPPASVVLSNAETARRLGVGLRSVATLHATGALARVQLSPRRCGTLEADLIAYIAARRTVAAPAAPLPSIDPAAADASFRLILADVLERRRRGA